jgi:hypothetical protein
MKGFFKFTTAALALVAMASCSNDDILTNGQAAEAQAEGALQVEMEQLIDGVTTRSAYVPNGDANALYWEEGDVIEVFDEALLKYDMYEFSPKRTTFENNSVDNVKTPAFAFTAGNTNWARNYFALSNHEWDSKKDQVLVTYDILKATTTTPNVLGDVNEEIASDKKDKKKAYQFALPMWGKATKAEDGKVSVSMKYLTAALRVQMSQLPSTWTDIRIVGFKDQACTPANKADLTGTFKAIVSEYDEVNEDAQLEVLTPLDQAKWGPVTYSNVLWVSFADWNMEELAWLRANGGYVYLPLIAQYYGALRFEFSTDNGATWNFLKKTKPFTAKRATMYRMSIEEFETAGSDAESVNVLLEKEKDNTNDVEIPTTFPTEISAGKNVIKIPAGMKAPSITFDLEGINDAGAGVPFEIESVDGKYAGPVILDLGDASVVSTSRINLNLPNSDVVIKGNLGTTPLGNISANDKLIVKSLTIAPITEDETDRGFTPTSVGNINPNYESFSTGDGIYVLEGATVSGNIRFWAPGEKGQFIENSEVVVNGTVTGNVNALLKDPEYTADKKDYYAIIPVTVDGGTVGGFIRTASPITLTDATVGDVTSIWSDVTASGTTSANSLEATNENVIMSGKATSVDVAAPKVELSEEANVTNEAVATTLSITGTAWAKDATMNADGTATINLTEEGEAITGTFTVDNTAITLTQGYINTIAGTTAALTFGEGEGFTAFQTITATVEFKNASTWNGKKIADKFAAYNTTSTNWVYTAVQLASNPYSASYIALGNDIDLNNEAWTPLALKTSFSGNAKTIKNLKVTATADNAGLFSTITVGALIANLTIDGAAVAATGKENVGVLAGSATANLTIEKVVVKNATVEGKYFLGGFVGKAMGANVSDDSNANGVTFTVNNPNNKPQISDASDAKAGSVGQFFGAVDGAVVVPAFTSAIDPATMGFKANFEVLAGNKAYCYYGGTRAAGLFAAGSTISVAGTPMVDAIGTKLDAKSTTNQFGYRLLLSAW